MQNGFAEYVGLLPSILDEPQPVDWARTVEITNFAWVHEL